MEELQLIRCATIEAAEGDRFELWARKRVGAGQGVAPFSVIIDGRVVYRIGDLPPYFDHFAYTHYGSTRLTLEWDESALDASLFYRFNEKDVAERGVTFVSLDDGNIIQHPRGSWPKWYAAERGRPQMRFSPFKGWMNDPNGLCRIGDSYHLFYQYHPNGTEWGPMHWGHAVSQDLYRWLHYPVFQHPERNLAALAATGGAFSGNAFVDRDGSLSFYYTERLPAYDLFKDYKEVQKRMRPSANLVRPVANELVLECTPPGVSHDFRDPKVWFDESAACYRMVLGSAVDGDPAILLYNSNDGNQWSFASVLYRAPAKFREGGARCAECPDFFVVDGHWVLVAGFVGYTEAETGRHNLLYAATGDFREGAFVPYSDELQELDFGTDYYAMQSFWDGQRQLAFAWLFNWEFRKPEGSAYSGEMSLPRVLKVDAGKHLIMQPEAGYKRLRQKRLDRPTENRIIASLSDAVELSLRGTLVDVAIEGVAANGSSFLLKTEGGKLVVSLPEDDGHIVYRSGNVDLRDLTLFFDRGVLEIFANDGLICGTRRTYRMTDLVSIEVRPGADTTIAHLEAWSLRSAWA